MEQEKMPIRITLHENKTINILRLMQKENIHIEASCGGNGKCGKCKTKLISGEVSEITELEKKILTEDEINNNIILACKRKTLSDVILELKEKKEFTQGKSYIKQEKKYFNPIVTKKYHKLNKPTLEDHTSDVERILREYNDNIQINLNLISKLAKNLKESDYKITTTILDNEIIKIEKGDTTNKNYAIALDIGTTTVAGYLVNLETQQIINSGANSNLQKKFGLDVISRINFAVQSKENLIILQKLVIETVDNVIRKLLKEGKIEKEDISIALVIGNTTMSHIFLGLPVDGISKAPFTPVFTRSIKFNADNVSMTSLSGDTRLILLPNIAGYVGSDTLGATISTNILNREGNWLALDIGTNCELILKTKDKIIACSTAAGPAFEGANMSCGMRAEPGGVYGLQVSDDFYPRTIENEEPIGICGSGYVDVVAKLLSLNLLKRQGRIKNPKELEGEIPSSILNRIEKSDKGYRIIIDKKGKVYITQEDISNLQLAKGAIKAGINIILKEGNIDKLDGILLAGTFGSNLDVESLKTIGMLPKIDSNKVEIVGNAAGSGAMDVILQKEIYDDIMNIQKKIEHIELASHIDFQENFIKSMMFDITREGLICVTQ